MKILHLEDDPLDAELVRLLLREEWPDVTVTLVSDRAGYLATIRHGGHDLILSDFKLPDFSGLEALALATEHTPDLPFIFVSGTIGEDLAIEAVQAGAADYVIKDRMKRLPTAIQRALREAGERRIRRETEAQLREREARYRGIFDNEPECIKLLDRDGGLLEMNTAGLNMIEADSIEQVRHTCVFLLVAPEHRAAFEALTGRVLGGASGILEFDVIGLRGTRRTLETHASPMRDGHGAVTALLGVTRDVTTRKESERRIREQAEYINQARDAIVVTDLVGNITFWNDAAERLSGWPRAEVLGRPLAARLVTGQEERLLAARNQVDETGTWQGEIRVQTKSGVPLEFDMRTTLLRDAAGRPTGRLNIGTDITEKKKLQEQFFRAQRLEGLGMLAAGIAHDLNNILTPILMAGPMLRKNATDPTDLRLLETLERSAERGASLVRQILSFAQGTVGRPQLLQVKHLIRDIIGLIEETFPKSIELNWSLAPNLWPILANATQIHQVLLNLCVNARDAMPNGGTLRLGGANLWLDATQAAAIPAGRPGAFVVITVQDNGTGIPPEAFEHMWEPFFTTKSEGKGTGLGLATVRGIVENHHGFIALQTTVGAGTTFEIYLPATEADAPPEQGLTSVYAPRGNGELLLLVDDETATRDVAQATLARHGYRVLVAANGAEALSLFIPRAKEVRLLITDLHMPTIDGAALSHILRRFKPDLPILAMSGMSGGREPGAEKPGQFASDFLSKPFKPEVLLVKVHALLQPGAATPT